MRNPNIRAIALAIGFMSSVGVMAESMSKEQYEATEKNIDAEYKSAKAGCNSLSGNAKDVCVAEAKGKSNIAKAELEVNHAPTNENRYKVLVAKAEASYSLAVEKCDDKAGNEKDVCVKEAKAAKVRAIADAKVQHKTANAESVANEQSADASAKARKQATDARKDATTDKHDADYAVAKEKCDALAGTAKEQCIVNAKLRFNQQ